jgi:hypothetical protein
VFAVPAPLVAGTELGLDVIVSHLDEAGSGRVAIELSADDFDMRFFHIDLRLWGQRQYVLFHFCVLNSSHAMRFERLFRVSEHLFAISGFFLS